MTALDEISLDILGKEIALATLAEVELAGGCIAALPGGSPEIQVPDKAVPMPPPSPSPSSSPSPSPSPAPAPGGPYPDSTCGFASTGPVNWAVHNI